MSHHSHQLLSKYSAACRSTSTSLSVSSFYGQREVFLAQRLLSIAYLKVKENRLLIFIGKEYSEQFSTFKLLTWRCLVKIATVSYLTLSALDVSQISSV